MPPINNYICPETNIYLVTIVANEQSILENYHSGLGSEDRHDQSPIDFDNKSSSPPRKLCKCGCGEKVDSEGHKFIYGHKKAWFKKQLKIKRCCKCGCTQEVIIKLRNIHNNIPKYIRGHHPFTDERRKKLSEAAKNREHFNLSEEHKKKISKALKGRKLGKTSGNHRKNLSKSLKKGFEKGRIPWNKGKTGVYSEERIKEMQEEYKKKNFVHNKPHSKSTKIKISKANKEVWKRPGYKESHPFWMGGVSSSESYPYDFRKVREKVLERDNYTCQECGCTQNQCGYKLCVHHIDYNKDNNQSNNLITLCFSCNSQANFDREYWTIYFLEKLEGRIQNEYDNRIYNRTSEDL